MSKPDAADIRRQVAETESRPLWTLPAAWFEDGAAERMAEWIKREREEARP